MKLTRLEDGKVFDLEPHQKEALTHLRENKRAGLFLEMSLQKTIVTLLYLSEMIYEEVAFCKTLIVAPDKVARLTWPNEINQWCETEHIRYSVVSGNTKQRLKALETSADIFIIGVDNLVWLIELFVKKKSGRYVGALPFDSLVIDELSLFKGRDSNRFKKLRKALELSDIDYRIGLTGTPSPNGLIDLWAEMMILDGGERLENTFGKYSDKYFKTRGNGMIVYEYIPRPGAANIIAHKMADIVLSMQLRDYKKLPDLILDDVLIEFEQNEKAIYEQLENEFVLDFLSGEDVTVKTSADLVNKLLQITSGAIYDSDKNWHELNSAKVDKLEYLVDQYPEENFLIIYQFRHELERIKARFSYARELPKGKALNQTFSDWNAGKIKMLVIHPASAGHGLNLQYGGRRMVWTSPTWNLEHWQQTLARLLRHGATKTIYAHRLLVKGTQDMRVCKRVNSKDTNQKYLLDEIKHLRTKWQH